MTPSLARTPPSDDGARQDTISRSSPLPLHHQVRHLLLDQISDGSLTPGDAIPPERSYAAQLGVSLAPVRQAILGLVKDGYLVRVPGKGTFVCPEKRTEDVTPLWSFTERMRNSGRNLEMQVIKQGLLRAPEDLAEALELRGAEVFELERLALEDGLPLALLTSYLDPEAFPGLDAIDFSRESLYATLRTRFATEVMRAENLIEVVACSAQDSLLLDIAEGSPTLHLSHLTFDQQDVPVEVSYMVYPANRVRLSLASRKDSGGAGDHAPARRKVPGAPPAPAE
jgi:GntR family transcriptional regulator